MMQYEMIGVKYSNKSSDLAKDAVFTDYMPGGWGMRENNVLKKNEHPRGMQEKIL